MITRHSGLKYGLLSLLLIVAAWLHIQHGVLGNPGGVFWKSIFHFDPANSSEVIFREIRIPRTFMAILAGAGLSVAGLLMQTYFSNPLAGPSVLGITSGSSLFVAIATLSGVAFFKYDLGIVTAALLGAFIFSLIILFFSAFVKSVVSLLLVGMMVASFTSAIVQVLQMSTNANDLKAFILWGFGSLQQVRYDQLWMMLIFFLVGLFLLLFLIKPLNLLVLGENQARLLGVNLPLNRIMLIAVASLFAGLITAYCGPISFIGLAVPNLVKALYRTQQHTHLILGCLLMGALTLLFCDLVVMWLEPLVLLPLNAITALLGSPVVVWIILKRF